MQINDINRFNLQQNYFYAFFAVNYTKEGDLRLSITPDVKFTKRTKQTTEVEIFDKRTNNIKVKSNVKVFWSHDNKSYFQLSEKEGEMYHETFDSAVEYICQDLSAFEQYKYVTKEWVIHVININRDVTQP